MKTFEAWWNQPDGYGGSESYGIAKLAWDAAMEEVGILAQATPPDPQHSRDVKPLAQYLAEYLEHEHENGEEYTGCFVDNYPDGSVNLDIICLEIALKQALDAYQSTENVKIRIERV